MFLDRDGTINVKAPEGRYITRPSEMRLLPGAGDTLRGLNEAGVKAIVVTNQRGIALRRMTVGDLDAVHEEMRRQLRLTADASVDAIFYCPHDYGQCTCRKPDIGLLLQALDHFPDIVLEDSVMIGDSAVDVETGERAGMRTIRVGRQGAIDLHGAVAQVLTAQ